MDQGELDAQSAHDERHRKYKELRELRDRVAELKVERDRLAAMVERVLRRCDIYRGMYEDKRGPLETLLGELDPAICANAAFARGVIAAVEDIGALAAPSSEGEIND